MAISVSPTIRQAPAVTFLGDRPLPALIICQACREPTRHTFARNERAGEYGAYAQIFCCQICGCLRRYGLLS